MRLEPGDRFGPFVIEGVLGRGGMGIVFRATDERLGRTVALKIAAPELLDSPADRERFEREARAAAAVQHPHVARVHGHGVEAGLSYLALEYVEGGSLADRLQREGRLDAREAARLGGQIAHGLSAVHAAGLVHRDLKPANVLLDGEGRAKLADFGLARRVGARSASRLTATGEIVGTPATVSPEQVLGEPVTARSDLYSLGATLFLLVTGEPPFAGGGVEVFMKHAKERPRSPADLVPELPGPLVALILALLEKRPDDRPGSAAEVADQLESIARSTDRRASTGPPGARGRRALAPVVGFAAVALAGAAVFGARRDPSVPAPVAAGPKKTPVAVAPGGVRSSPTPTPTAAPRIDPPEFARSLAHGASVDLVSALGTRRPEEAPPDAPEIESLALSPDGARLVAGHWGGSVRLWDVERGVLLDRVDLPKAKTIHALAFTCEGRTVVVTTDDDARACGTWTPGSDVRWIKTISPAQRAVRALPDGTLATADLRDQLFLVDPEWVDAVRRFKTDMKTLSIDRVGRRLVLVGQRGSVRLFDLDRGELTRTGLGFEHGHMGDIAGVAASPDGSRFLTAGGDGTLRLWDTRAIDEGVEPRLIGEPSFVVVPYHAVAFLDGRTAVTCAADGKIQLWDTETLKAGEVIDLHPLGDRGSVVLSRAGGTEFLVASARGVIYRFRRRSRP